MAGMPFPGARSARPPNGVPMNAPETIAARAKARFSWDDPLLLDAIS